MYLLANVRLESDYLNKRKGTLPQPSHSFGFAPGIVHVPNNEQRMELLVGLRNW